MQRVLKSSCVVFTAIGLVVIGSLPAMAQSGSRNYPPTRSSGRTAPPAGSGQRAQDRAPLALEGYCAVSILDMNEWIKGNPAHRVLHDGRDYLFANEKGQRMFQANPAKYVPALGNRRRHPADQWLLRQAAIERVHDSASCQIRFR